MNKWQIICPLVALAIVAAAWAVIIGSQQHRYYILAQTEMIGKDLVATTKSQRLDHLGPDLQQRLSGFVGSTKTVVETRWGDEPSPIGDGAACSRLILSNAFGGSLGIRLRQDSAPERFHVLGFWTITEPNSLTNGNQPFPTEKNRKPSTAGSHR